MNKNTNFCLSPLVAMIILVSEPAIAQDSFGNNADLNNSANSQSYPSQKGYPSQQQGYPQQQGMLKQQTGKQGGQPNFAAVMRLEKQDFGIAPIKQLHNDQMHGPTPTQIPGGQLISTEALYKAMQQQGNKIIVFDVLGGLEILPGAQNAIGAANGGSFNDQTQQAFGSYLNKITNGNKSLPLVFYCQGVQCWMSYNAALRAINLGYSQVKWYRGGMDAWKAAELATNSMQY